MDGVEAGEPAADDSDVEVQGFGCLGGSDFIHGFGHDAGFRLA